MPHGSVSDTISAPSAEVFHLLQDYDRRLEWDTLLRQSYLCDDWPEAELHATAVCTGRWYLGGISVKTEYVSFTPPRVAAVKMVNRPAFFQTFAATIRHQDLGNGSSTIEYKYHFTARPSWLRWALDPVMAAVFHWETRRRLRAVRRRFAERSDSEIPRDVATLGEASSGPKLAAELTEGPRRPKRSHR